MATPERAAAAIIVFFELALGVCLVIQRIKFVRWRREYEFSVDRAIRTIRPGV